MHKSKVKPARRLGALALAAGLLAGCGSMAPPLRMPPLPVADRYPADAPAVEGAAAPGLAWDTYFTDPALRRLIGHALACNRDLRQSILRVREAAAETALQHAQRVPAADASLGAQRTRIPPIASGLGRSVLTDEFQAQLGVRWELDMWGRLASLDEAATEAWLASDANRRALTASLVAQVAEVYYGLRELDERTALAEAALASRNESLRIFRRRYEVGATTRLDLTQVETLQTQAEMLLLTLRQEHARLGHALALLTGADALPAPAPLWFDETFVPLESGMPSALLLARPDIAAAEHRLRAANANIGAARAAFFPRIALTGARGGASTALGALFDAQNAAWSAGASLAQPLVDGGRNRAALARSEVERDIALAAYEKTVQQAFREVADALTVRATVRRQVEVGARALAAQRERARLAKLRYERGAVTYLDVLDAERDLLQVEQQQVQNRRALLSSQVALYLALGGGGGAAAAPETCEPGMER